MTTSTETPATEQSFIRYRHLVNTANNDPSGSKGYYVLVSHAELDGLVGRLMQMCDLTGDAKQRKALKDTIKQISRDWLDDLYIDSGYNKWTGLKEGVTSIEC